jgi:hypothetical protein
MRKRLHCDFDSSNVVRIKNLHRLYALACLLGRNDMGA